MDKKQPVIIPCCGIDSVYGLITQEVALKIEAEVSNRVKLLGLAYLVNGEIDAVQAITNTPCIVINGCSKECASNIVDVIGGDIDAEYVIDDLIAGIDVASLGDAVKLSEEGKRQVGKITSKLIAEIVAPNKGAETC